MSQRREKSEAVSTLLELLADAVNIVDGKIATACGQSASVGFTYINPIDGKAHTATGYTLTPCPPPGITAFRTADGKWYIVGRHFAKQVQERLLQVRQRRPKEEIDDRVLVGYLYSKTVPGETAVICPPADPDHPDEPVEPPPPDPDYLHSDRSYGKTWVSYFTPYHDDVERWLFGQQPNCGLPISVPSDSLGWLPHLPTGEAYQDVRVSTFATYLRVLYTAPSFTADRWIGYNQALVRRQGNSPTVDFVVLYGVAKAFPGDTAPDAVPPFWVYLGEAAGFSPYPVQTYRVLGNTANKECAPKLPPPPQPPSPPLLPPNPADRKSVEIWFSGNKQKTPLKLKTLSEQETMGKGDIVFLSPKQVLVILKYGNAKNDGAPNTIDRGYCRFSIFKIPGDGGTPFTEIALTWELVAAGAAFSALLQLGVAQKNLFVKALSTCSFYADDAVGYLEGQPNPLYAAWIKAGTLRESLLTCGARQLRNLSKNTSLARVYLPDPYPPEALKEWRADSYYNTQPILNLASHTVTLTLQCLQVAASPVFDNTQPESPTNRKVDLFFERNRAIKKFKLPAAGGSIMTIACAAIDERSLR